MMWLRPYLAVIADSFRAAFASRVLWAAMLAIWLLLAALVPLGTREDYTTSFRWFDLYNGTRMKALLARGLVDPAEANQPLGRLARAMPDELQRKLRRVGEGDEVRIRVKLLTDALNEMIDSDAQRDNESDPGWYDAQAWKETVRLRELRELDASETAELDESLLRRRARLRIEAALPGVFEARSSRSILLTYGTLDFPTGFEIDRAQFELLFNQFVIPTLVHWLLGFVLVFLGVLVTASIIPDMLQPGSLHLLLSKPISRSGLLVAKFVGGCAFVCVCVAQLVVGLYLIAGWRLGIWNPRILFCIPVAIVLFAVFFAVSVPAGLKWRSPIISIAAAGALAAICIVVGVIGGLFEARIEQPDRIETLTVIGDDWIGSTGGSGLVRFERDTNQWVELIASEAMTNDRVLKPIAHDDATVLTAKVRGGRFNPFGSGALDLISLSREDDWAVNPVLRLPNATEGLRRLSDGHVMAINTADVLIADAKMVRRSLSESPSETDDQPAKTRADSPSSRRGNNDLGSWLRALTTLQGGANDDFVSILPPKVVLSPPTRLAIVERPESIDLFVLTRDQLQRLSTPRSETSSRWQLKGAQRLEPAAGSSSVILTGSRDVVVVCRADGSLQTFASTDLKPLASEQLPDGIAPIQIVPWSGKPNRFFVRTTQGEVRVLTTDSEGQFQFGPAANVNKARCLAMDTDNQHLLVAYETDSVATFELSDVSDQMSFPSPMTFAPTLSFWRWIDRFVLGAVETITPPVMQLGETTASIVSGESAFVMERGESATADVIQFDAKGPLIGCFAFIAMMLTLSCVYFSRADY
ncbi:MAG: ABC transporter permease [Planctomycetota bacterium]